MALIKTYDAHPLNFKNKDYFDKEDLKLLINAGFDEEFNAFTTIEEIDKYLCSKLSVEYVTDTDAKKLDEDDYKLFELLVKNYRDKDFGVIHITYDDTYDRKEMFDDEY